MKNQIYKILEEIERENNIRILFAIESGSRAWGMESINSDYDVRFVYCRKSEEYLRLDLPEDVITKHFDKNLKQSEQKGCFVDILGFDLFKFLRMLVKNNPTCLEWLQSNIIYYGKKNEVFKEWSEMNFNKIAVCYHYKSMCSQNYKKYIDSGNEITYKKYLYAMRGLVNARYVILYGKMPNINFPELLKEIRGKGVVKDYIINELESIIELKKKLKEKEIVKNYKRMDEYIETFLKQDLPSPQKRTQVPRTILNNEILKILNER